MFDKFKKQAEKSPALEKLTRAREQFDTGEYQPALGTLGWGFREDVNYKPLYELASACLEKLGGNEEKDLFDKALAGFDSPEPFRALGTHFFNDGHYGLAMPFLEKALAFHPSDVDTAHDLALTYARRFEIPKAVKTLANVNARQDFWALYFLAKCNLLNRDILNVPEYIASLEAALNSADNKDQLEVPVMKVEELKETLQRYKTIDAPAVHIRDWQFIQYGSIILDYFDDSEDYVAGGRYVASWGSNEAIKSIAERATLLLGHLNVSIQTVQSLKDRNAEIIARVMAAELGADFSFYDAGQPVDNCLVVAADAAGFNEYPELSEIKQGQLLFALNQSWLEPALINPDITGFMTQSYYFPWDEGGFKVMDIETGNAEKTGPGNRPAEEIAGEIAGLATAEQDTAELFSFYKQRAGLIKGIGRSTNNNRYNFMIESPVPGSYFGN